MKYLNVFVAGAVFMLGVVQLERGNIGWALIDFLLAAFNLFIVYIAHL